MRTPTLFLTKKAIAEITSLATQNKKRATVGSIAAISHLKGLGRNHLAYDKKQKGLMQVAAFHGA